MAGNTPPFRVQRRADCGHGFVNTENNPSTSIIRFMGQSSAGARSNPAKIETWGANDWPILRRRVRSSAELQDICPRTRKQCRGFEQVNEVLIQPRDSLEGAANWTLAAVR